MDEIYEQTKNEHIDVVDAIKEIHDKVYQEAYKQGYELGLSDGETNACSEGGLRCAYEQGKEEAMANAVGLFIAQCGEMAEQNWCPAQVEMLERLFGAVLTGVAYADYEVPADA